MFGFGSRHTQHVVTGIFVGTPRLIGIRGRHLERKAGGGQSSARRGELDARMRRMGDDSIERGSASELKTRSTFFDPGPCEPVQPLHTFSTSVLAEIIRRQPGSRKTRSSGNWPLDHPWPRSRKSIWWMACWPFAPPMRDGFARSTAHKTSFSPVSSTCSARTSSPGWISRSRLSTTANERIRYRFSRSHADRQVPRCAQGLHRSSTRRPGRS